MHYLLNLENFKFYFVLYAQHTTQTPLCDMLPHHQIIYNDVILPSV